MKTLNHDQQRFAKMVEDYPKFSEIWDTANWTCNTDAYARCKMQDARCIGIMSSDEITLARFFMMVWSHKNGDFDLTDAAAKLNRKDKELITSWLLDPFWP